MWTLAAAILVAAYFYGIWRLLNRPPLMVNVDPPLHPFDGYLLTLRGVCRVCGAATEHPIHRRRIQ